MLACLLTYVCLFATIALGAAKEPAVQKMIDVKNSPALIGGRIADDDELPFSVFIDDCTASIVGPETILTAGHCRASGESVEFRFDNRVRKGTCTRHPQFNPNRGSNFLNNDFALCKFSPRINDEDAFADLSPVGVDVNDIVILQGFGQNRLGTLQVGTARVVEINGQDIKTNSSVRLGGGDSGGGLVLGNNTRRGPFRIVGVNSRVGGSVSFFNRVNLARTQDFFEDFARNERVEICGVNRSCRGGNGGGNADCDAEQEIVDFFKGELDDAERLLDQCLDGRKK